MAEKNIVRNWRGTRKSYNFLRDNRKLDPWTRYAVIESDGASGVTEYFGYNKISEQTGQLLPVKSILPTEPSSGIMPYDRYLVGQDGSGYNIIEYTLCPDRREGVKIVKEVLPFDERYGVRVLSEGLKNFVYIDGTLRTYDDVDCGIF